MSRSPWVLFFSSIGKRPPASLSETAGQQGQVYQCLHALTCIGATQQVCAENECERLVTADQCGGFLQSG